MARILLEGNNKKNILLDTMRAGIIWFCILQVKELPQYQAVATNTSGSTPRDLYEGVAEDLEKQVIQITFQVISFKY